MRIGTFVVSRDGDLELRRHAIEDAFVISIEDGFHMDVSIIYINTNEEGEILASLVSVREWGSHMKIRSDCVAITHPPRERNACSATLGFG